MNNVTASDSVTEAVHHWIDALVVGLNLCPFASAAKRNGHLKIAVCDNSSVASCLQFLADEAHPLAKDHGGLTTLVVLPVGFDNFDDYLDLLALAEALLEDLGFAGTLQLASFHPLYQFEGTAPEDVGNWTNRAPYPILHLLREDDVTKAVQAHPDPERIPENNIDTLEKLGLAGVLRLLRSCA